MPDPPAQSPTRRFLVGLARAAGGALVFALPIWMTEETWHLGTSISSGRLALFVVLTCPFLVALSHVSGYERTVGLKDDLVDAAVAWAVGFLMAGAGLALLGKIRPAEVSWRVMLGRMTLLAIPGSVGALLAQSQFGGNQNARADRPSTYASQLVVMLAGALYLAFNIAPTHEVEVVALVIAPANALSLAVVTVAVMHAFVYALEFTGDEPGGARAPLWHAFLRYTVVGYAVALFACAYMLWTFGRLDGTGLGPAAHMLVVLGFPAAVGAASARLVL